MQKHYSLVAVIILLITLVVLPGCGSAAKPETTSGGSAGTGTSTAFSSTESLKLSIPADTNEQTLTIPGWISSGQKVYINGKEQLIDLNGDFTVTLDLVPGNNTISVKIVSDDGKSIYSTGKNIVYTPKKEDITPPTLNVTFPTTSATPTLTLQGRTDPHCTVNANGQQTTSDDVGNFIVSLPLHEGDNIITVTAVNGKGLKSTRQQVVQYQTPKKEILLNVSLPEGNTGYVSQKRITINGFTDPENILEVYVNYFNDDGEIQSLVFRGTVSSGQFSVNASLAEGANTIIVKATNKEGQSKTVERSVYYKTE